MTVSPIVTPVGELIWSSLTRPHRSELSEAYQITLILNKSDTAKLIKLCWEAYTHQTGEEPPANFQLSVTKLEGEDRFRMTFRRKAKTKKGMDAEPVPVVDPFGSESFREIPNGSIGRVKFFPFSYEYAGKKGISLYLVSAQLLKAAGSNLDTGFEVDEVALAAQKSWSEPAPAPKPQEPEAPERGHNALDDFNFDDDIPF